MTNVRVEYGETFHRDQNVTVRIHLQQRAKRRVEPQAPLQHTRPATRYSKLSITFDDRQRLRLCITQKVTYRFRQIFEEVSLGVTLKPIDYWRPG